MHVAYLGVGATHVLVSSVRQRYAEVEQGDVDALPLRHAHHPRTAARAEVKVSRDYTRQVPRLSSQENAFI